MTELLPLDDDGQRITKLRMYPAVILWQNSTATFPNHQTGIVLMKSLLVITRMFWQEALEGVES